MKKIYRFAFYLLAAILFISPGILAGCGNGAPAASSSSGTQDTQSESASTSSAAQDAQSETATIRIRNGDKTQSGKVSVQQNETVFTLLKRFTEAEHIEMSATGTGEMVYVTSIDNKKAGKNAGWLFTVNGKQPEKGAGAIKVKPGDRIEWHYSDY